MRINPRCGIDYVGQNFDSNNAAERRTFDEDLVDDVGGDVAVFVGGEAGLPGWREGGEGGEGASLGGEEGGFAGVCGGGG